MLDNLDLIVSDVDRALANSDLRLDVDVTLILVFAEEVILKYFD
jgi:hypothetical protein